MAKRLLTTLRLVNLSSDPVSASNGDIYYNSATNKAKFYQNGTWVNMPSILGDLSDVSASGVSNGQVLTYNGTLSRWEPESSPPAATATGTVFPQNPSDGEFFFNTDTEQLYFFYTTWNEIEFTRVALNGGLSSDTVFDLIADNGDSSTESFTAVYDGGDSSSEY
jgi:hypothetical protein